MSGPTTTTTADLPILVQLLLWLLWLLQKSSTHAGLCDLKDCHRVTAYIKVLLQLEGIRDEHFVFT